MSEQLLTVRVLLEHDDNLQLHSNQPNLNRRVSYASQANEQNLVLAIYLPTYVYCFISELIKVDLAEKLVQCKFIVFVTVQTHLQEAITEELKKRHSRLIQQRYGEQGIELKKLAHFLNNNFIIECGNQTIDIVNADQDQHSNHYQRAECQEDDKESHSEENYFWTKVSQQKDNYHCVTYKIQGIFDCKFQLENLFFPYHSINSGLQIKIRQQYYSHMVIKYDLCKIQQQKQQKKAEYPELKQFSLKFIDSNQGRFGIYRINFKAQTYRVQRKQNKYEFQNRESFRFSRRSVDYGDEFIEGFSFNFEVYGYSVPFILRYLVPLLVLCFVSLMNYFSDIKTLNIQFGNVILLTVTLVQQLSNFRKSKYDNNSFNIYQATIIGIIVIVFLLAIITVKNYYAILTSEDDAEHLKFVNHQDRIFWIAVGIAALLMGINTFVVVYFKCQVESHYSWEAFQVRESKYFNYISASNHEILGTAQSHFDY